MKARECSPIFARPLAMARAASARNNPGVRPASRGSSAIVTDPGGRLLERDSKPARRDTRSPECARPARRAGWSFRPRGAIVRFREGLDLRGDRLVDAVAVHRSFHGLAGRGGKADMQVAGLVLEIAERAFGAVLELDVRAGDLRCSASRRSLRGRDETFLQFAGAAFHRLDGRRRRRGQKSPCSDALWVEVHSWACAAVAARAVVQFVGMAAEGGGGLRRLVDVERDQAVAVRLEFAAGALVRGVEELGEPRTMRLGNVCAASATRLPSVSLRCAEALAKCSSTCCVAVESCSECAARPRSGCRAGARWWPRSPNRDAPCTVTVSWIRSPVAARRSIRSACRVRRWSWRRFPTAREATHDVFAATLQVRRDRFWLVSRSLAVDSSSRVASSVETWSPVAPRWRVTVSPVSVEIADEFAALRRHARDDAFAGLGRAGDDLAAVRRQAADDALAGLVERAGNLLALGRATA